MAKTKEPTIKDSLLIFKDVLKRSKISNLVYQKNVIMGKHKDGYTVFFIVEEDLWILASQDGDIMNNMVALDTEKYPHIVKKFLLAEGMNIDEWIGIDPDQMYSGELVHITIDNLDYDIPINVKVFPLKLRKTEFTGFAYRITTTADARVITIRKKFETPIPDTGFYIAVPFQIV